MKKNVIADNDTKINAVSAEERIKNAARKLFTSNGFAAVKTRDIAKEAGINPALLHYYFRSKDNLFNIIMLENLSLFIAGIAAILYDEKTSIEQKIEKFIATYIDKLTKEPELVLFIVNQVKVDPDGFLNKLGIVTRIQKSYFLKQVLASDYPKMLRSLNPLHIAINTVGLTIAPFLMAPIIQTVFKMDQSRFAALMQERKVLIPKWIEVMVKKGSRI